MYFNDSVAMKVYAYDFDLESGSLSNKRLLIDRRPTYGEPDGMVAEYAIFTLYSSLLGPARTTSNLFSLAQTATSGSPVSTPTESWSLPPTARI